MRLFNDLTKTRLRAIVMGIASTAVIAAAPAFAHSAPNVFATDGDTNAPAADDGQGDAVDGWDVSGSEDLADETSPDATQDAGTDEETAHSGGHHHHAAPDRLKPSQDTVDVGASEDGAGDEDQVDQGDENDQGQVEDSNKDSSEDASDDQGDESQAGDTEDSGDEDSGEHDGETGGDQGDTGDDQDGGGSDD
jgi:hypothetical protein